ncbi:cysteine desulfurase [Hyphobacterium sp. CCMP332]|nr:cysteine desulfurase [Hyphobacterium sp. CCMP332]
MKVYLDNAATTPIDPQVIEAMMPYLREIYGNPSSTHAHGRMAKSALEKGRKRLANLINASPSEVFFTSGGTEADNTAICCTIRSKNIKHAITSPIEHHAVLHTLENEEKLGNVKLSKVNVDRNGNIDFEHLTNLVAQNPGSLISLMHANNEIGNLNPIEAIAQLSKEHNCYFHTDTVQTMGHYLKDVHKIGMDFMVGSAHKFHGPKGVGFLYVNKDLKISPFIQGGSQERNMRGGTENIAGIMGMIKALELACADIERHQAHVQGLKSRMMKKLKENIPEIEFNGNPEDERNSLYTVLNVCLPESDDNDMLLFNLDLAGISCSAGSACTSGSNLGSHVLTAIGANPNRGAVRFSFSKFNTVEEVDYAVEKLAEIYAPVTQ